MRRLIEKRRWYAIAKSILSDLIDQKSRDVAVLFSEPLASESQPAESEA